MILADKIIHLRKKMGWSQEELAEKMDVSRQAVSKWESAQSVPDLAKILQLSELFGVTTDYLLKDGIEAEETSVEMDDPSIRRIGLDEVGGYLTLREKAAWRIALATLLCILSPLALIVLGVLSEPGSPFVLSETAAGVIGLVVLFALVLCAVVLYLRVGFANAPYEFLESGTDFSLGHGVRELVEKRKKDFCATYVRCNIIATCLCILSPIPLIVSAFFAVELVHVAMMCAMFWLAGGGVFLFIWVGVRQASMEKLLREGDYSPRKYSMASAVESAYWGIVVALYLTVSFLTGAWHLTWLIFVIGGAFAPMVDALCRRIGNGDSKNKK